MGGGVGSARRGVLLVAGSALIWSFGGTIARFLAIEDSWTIVFWRSLWATLFLLAFLLLRDGVRGTVTLFRGMGWPGVGVALCFALASPAFVVALAYTTVANILLVQAGVPLIAALIGWLVLREHIPGTTWIAVAAVIAGIAVMVSGSFTGQVSPIGDALALLIAVVIAIGTVITRRYAHVRMTPACCLGMAVAAVVSSFLASGLAVPPSEHALLFVFGALNLGLGMAFFVTGARLLPAAIAALIGTLEPVLGPIGVWLVHGETPSLRTVIGGAIVLGALLGHLAWQIRSQRRPTP